MQTTYFLVYLPVYLEKQYLMYGYNFLIIEFVIFKVIFLITLVELSIGFLIGSFIGLKNIEETGEVLLKCF